MDRDYNPWLHRFSHLVAASTFLLIFVGGLVTSTGSGLAVPDWPTTYGRFMFSFPLDKMVGGILYEHGHRMIATVVGVLTVILTAWLWLKEPRRWVKWFGVAALLAVIIQGILGGITVRYLLPTSISVLHGCLAQGFFMMMISLVVFTSKEWIRKDKQGNGKTDIRSFAVLTTVLVYLQLVLGAIMRHSGAGLAIPDFPLAFGKLIPTIDSQAVAIHFLHRVGALVVTLSILTMTFKLLRTPEVDKGLTRPAFVLVAALIVQIALAALTIWSQKAVLPTTLHVANGAFILGVSLFLSLRAQIMFADDGKATHPTYLMEQPTAS